MSASALEVLEWPWFSVLYHRNLALDDILLVATITQVDYSSGEVVMLHEFTSDNGVSLWVRSRTDTEAVAAAERTLRAVLPDVAWELVAVHELGAS